MARGDYDYIWQASNWPDWRYDLAALARPLADVSHAQGLLMGRLADVGMVLRDQASLAALTDDVVKTSEIAGAGRGVTPAMAAPARRMHEGAEHPSGDEGAAVAEDPAVGAGVGGEVLSQGCGGSRGDGSRCFRREERRRCISRASRQP